MKKINFFKKCVASIAIAFGVISCGGTGTETTGETKDSTAALDTSAPIKLGFIPLTDCSPIVMAQEWGLFKKYGVNVIVEKQASWAVVRDKLLTGELDGSHCLFGMPFSVYTMGAANKGKELKIAMNLNVNGQAITLSKDFCGKVGVGELAKVNGVVTSLAKTKEVTFAATFPGGTHDIWMRNFLSLSGVDQNKVKQITIPPPQMVANMKTGTMDGYCVGEPWNGKAVKEGIGFTTITTQEIWKDHPEKALVVNSEFAEKRREDLKKVMKAIMEACIMLDNMEKRGEVAKTISQEKYVNAPAEVTEGRLKGEYNMGCDYGTKNYADNVMMFHKDGYVNMPRVAHGMWFMAQYMRFGMLDTAPNYQEVAQKLILSDLYKEVALEMKIPLPEDDMKPFSLTIDKTVFDPANVADYLAKVNK
jgi:nitrate/nitrite transport system substrate-binding protein